MPRPSIATTPPPDPNRRPGDPHPDRPRGRSFTPTLALRRDSEVELAAQGDKCAHLMLPDPDRTTAFVAASPFVLYSTQKRSVDDDPPEAVRIILTRVEVVRLSSVTQADARAILGKADARLPDLAHWWLRVHDRAYAARAAELDDRAVRRALSFGTPPEWQRWRDRYVWRLEWERDLSEQPRWVDAWCVGKYVHSSARALDPTAEAIPAADQALMTAAAQPAIAESQDVRRHVRHLARRARKARHAATRYGDKVPGLSEHAEEIDAEVRRLSGEGRIPGHVLRAAWEDDQ